MVFTLHSDSRKLCVTLPDRDKTGKFECLLAVCESPICRCRSVYLTFTGQASPDGRQHEWKASLDLDLKGIVPEFKQAASHNDGAFCERLVTEMDAHDFQLLGHLHFIAKNQLTEKAKPESINAHFDFAKIESSSTMQVYNDILPFGDRLLVAADGTEYILLDQHCVRVGCDCTETYIEILPVLTDGTLDKNVGTILLDYANRQWQLAPDNDTPCDLPLWRQRIESSLPGLYPQLARRHSKLQAIYRHCRKRHLAATRQTNLSLPRNIGRNELCPCGSGKKYKKCCLAVAAPAAPR